MSTMKVNSREIFILRESGWTLDDLALRYGCSKSAISLYLHRRRTRTNAPRPPKLCACGCGTTISSKNRKYASEDCYFTAVCRRPYVSWRQGQRIARRLISSHFRLGKRNVVHHVDGD